MADDGVSVPIATKHTKEKSYGRRNTPSAFTGSENSLVAGILAPGDLAIQTAPSS